MLLTFTVNLSSPPDECTGNPLQNRLCSVSLFDRFNHIVGFTTCINVIVHSSFLLAIYYKLILFVYVVLHKLSHTHTSAVDAFEYGISNLCIHSLVLQFCYQSTPMGTDCGLLGFPCCSYSIFHPWASNQIRKIAGCVFPGKVRNAFPATDLKVSDPGMHHGASRTCRDACRNREPAVSGKRSRHSRRMRNPQFCVSGKRPMSPAISPLTL